MKRIGTTLVTIFALCIALVGCGKKVDYKAELTGSWELVAMAKNGTDVGASSLETLKGLGLHTYLDLNEDGTASFEMNGGKTQGAWEDTEDGNATLTLDNQSIPLSLSESQLIMQGSTSTLTFDKIDPSQKVAAPTESNPALDAITGKATYYGGDSMDDLTNVTELYIPLYDDETCTITAVAKGDYDGDPGILFEFVNKTKKDILFTDVEDWTVNGEKAPVTLYETVKAGETLQSIAFFDAATVGDDVDELTDFAGTIYLLDAADSETPITNYNFSF